MASVVLESLKVHCSCFSVVLEATYEVQFRAPLRGAVSAQKALQGSETKKDVGRVGMKENNILLNEGFLTRANRINLRYWPYLALN